MKRKIVRIVAIAIVAALVLSLLMIPFAGIAYAAEKDDEVTILFTHDLHDHILPVNTTDADGNTTSSGGYARLKTVMDEVRSNHDVTFTLDAGDFSMGSLFQSIFSTDAPELRLMGALGIDVTTFGNHEFDYGPASLSLSLDAAMESGDTLPQIVAANYTTPAEGDQASEAALALVRSMTAYGVSDYTVLEREGIRIAVFGLVGHNSHDCSPASQMAHDDPIETAKRVVADIQANEEVDMIVCLSHSGTADDPEQSEDELLAQAVPEIDLIVSGHTHTTLNSPLQVGNTFIVSSGPYAENLGVITLRCTGDGWTPAAYELKPIDGSVTENPAISEKIDHFKDIVQEEYLSMYGTTFDQVLTHNTVLFTPQSQIGATNDELPLGNLLADSYFYALQQIEGEDYTPITLAVVPRGLVRASLPLGDLTVSDAFNVLSLGVGKDGSLGYPLVSGYLTGKELMDLAEIDASVSLMMPDAKLYFSGITYTYNPNRMPLDYVTDLSIVNPEGKLLYPAKDRLYRIVTDIYSAQMFSSVEDLAYGFLNLTPKDAEGNEITDFNTAIIYDSNGNEVKAWHALAAYLYSFENNTVPQRYAQTEDRIVMDDDDSLGALVSNPGPITLLVIGVILLFSCLIIAVGLIIVRRIEKRTSIYETHPNRLDG